MKKNVLKEIIGTWKLKSIFYIDDAGNKIDLYGENPLGILMYDNFGYMNAQLGRSDRNNNLGYDTNLNKKILDDYGTYLAYYGKYFEEEAGVIIHRIEGCTNSKWEGIDVVRYVSINNNILNIATPLQEVGGIMTKLEVYWQKIN